MQVLWLYSISTKLTVLSRTLHQIRYGWHLAAPSWAEGIDAKQAKHRRQRTARKKASAAQKERMEKESEKARRHAAYVEERDRYVEGGEVGEGIDMDSAISAGLQERKRKRRRVKKLQDSAPSSIETDKEAKGKGKTRNDGGEIDQVSDNGAFDDQEDSRPYGTSLAPLSGDMNLGATGEMQGLGAFATAAAPALIVGKKGQVQGSWYVRFPFSRVV